MRIISLMLLPSLRMPDNPRMLLNIAKEGSIRMWATEGRLDIYA